MLVAKFVTPDLKSPGIFEQLDYSNFGSPISIPNPDPEEYGQCARGIHVFPLTENIDFDKVIFTDTIILLHVEPEHIIFQENNGKMRVAQAIPIKQLTKQDSEWELIKKECLKTPKYAYRCALKIDQQPIDDTRNASLIDPEYAYYYARYIDRRPRNDTRNACLKDPYYAYYYARDIDKCSRDDTRNACLIDSYYALQYAKEIDKQPRDDTKLAASNDSYWNLLYEQFETEYNEKTK
jgi:hypothetical protein